MSDIILLSGSPAVNSGSTKLLDVVGSMLVQKDHTTTKLSVIDIPLEDLFYGRSNSPALVKVFREVEEAKGVVISSPVYKASYPGVLKSLLDVFPKYAFKGKAVLPIMTGGSPAHLLALEYALKPLIAVMKGNSLAGVYVTDDQIDKQKERPIIDDGILERMKFQVNQLSEAIQQNLVEYT